MQFLSKRESEDWCSARGYPLPAAFRSGRVPDGYVSHEFRIPPDAGARIALCRALWRTQHGPEVERTLLWMTDWSVWPSGEHMPLFARLRSALGETRPLAERPGNLCVGDDGDDGLSVLVVACLFLWDCWAYSDGGLIVALSHDAAGAVYGPPGRLTADARSVLAQLGELP